MKNKLLFEGSEWDFDKLSRTWDVIDHIGSKELGFDYYPAQIEIISSEQMLDNYANHAMPIMYGHWSFGKSFIKNRNDYLKGRSGLAYEVVINTNPSIAYLMEDNTMTMQALVMAHASCVDKNTECLTNEGWIKISEYNGQKIAQYCEDGTIQFKKPIRYIETNTNKFLQIKAQGISQQVTLDHTMVYKGSNGKLKKESANEFLERHLSKTRGHNGKFITHFRKADHTNYAVISADLRLQVAIKADGSRQGQKYRFHLKKNRKIERLEQLLREASISYTKVDTYGGRVSIRFDYPEIPKEYTWEEYFRWGNTHLEIVGNEVLYWDGDQKNNFSTTIKQSADIIQLVWASLGYGTHIYTNITEGKKDCYSVSRSPYAERSISKSRGGIPNKIKEVEGGKAYCFTTDTGMWVARRDNCIFVTGNCGHSGFFKTNYLFRDWSDADSILDYLKYAKRYISECEKKYGYQKVEILLDACHSLQLHGIDKYKKPRLSKEVQEKKIKAKIDHDDQTFNDIWRTVPTHKSELMDKHAKEDPFKDKLPEENLLYFIEKYSPKLEPWEKEIVRIVRKIAQYFYPQRQTGLMNEGFACVQGDTEYLSPKGWKKIKDYDGGKVAQYLEDGSIEYVDPSNYIVQKNKELLDINAIGISQCVTPDHRMIYKSGRGHLNECRADELTLTSSRKFISFGNLKTDTKANISDIHIRIMAAIVADGSFNPNTITTYCQCGFVKERKIRRLERLLKLAGIAYKKEQYTQGRTSINFYAPLRSKLYNDFMQGASHEQLKILLDEAKHWDAHERSSGRTHYFSTNLENISFLQTAISLTGKEGRITIRNKSGNNNTIYILEPLQSQSNTLDTGTMEKVKGLHDVYCFTVPSGMFLTKRNHKINVTGNCLTHYTIMNMMFDQGYISAGSIIEFLKSHSGVVYQPDWDDKRYSGINVYALGFAMMNDIKRMCMNPDEEDKALFPSICNTDWRETIKHVVENYRDESFVLQFLSPKVIKRFKLGVVQVDEEKPYYEVINVHHEDHLQDIRKVVSAQYDISKRVPNLEIVGVDWRDTRTMTVRHYEVDGVTLTHEDAKRTTQYLCYLWGFPIRLEYE